MNSNLTNCSKLKVNLISMTAVHVYDSFYMQFPSIRNFVSETESMWSKCEQTELVSMTTATGRLAHQSNGKCEQCNNSLVIAKNYFLKTMRP